MCRYQHPVRLRKAAQSIVVLGEPMGGLLRVSPQLSGENTVDGNQKSRRPTTGRMVLKPVVNKGINYQPQQVSRIAEPSTVFPQSWLLSPQKNGCACMSFSFQRHIQPLSWFHLGLQSGCMITWRIIPGQSHGENVVVPWMGWMGKTGPLPKTKSRPWKWADFSSKRTRFIFQLGPSSREAANLLLVLGRVYIYIPGTSIQSKLPWKKQFKFQVSVLRN